MLCSGSDCTIILAVKGVIMMKITIKGSTLKIIAVITMITDHIGASVLQVMLNDAGLIGTVALGIEAILKIEGEGRTLAIIWWFMRIVIGRIAFPIYCFLLIEGFIHTKNIARYSLRLFVFALISEVPFDLALFHKAYTPMYQNVFFTLLIGLLTMWGLSKVKSRLNGNIILSLLIIAAGLVLAEGLNTDYGAAGVLFILLLYLYRYNKSMQLVVGCVSGILILQEMAAPLSFLFISAYNGERGLKLKYLFYTIYPVHLILLYGVCIMLGLV